MNRMHQGLLLVFGLPALAIGGAVWHAMANAEDRMSVVCPKFAVGMTAATAEALGQEQGLRGKVSADGANYLGEAWSYERYGCRITTEKGIVTAAAVARRDS